MGLRQLSPVISFSNCQEAATGPSQPPDWGQVTGPTISFSVVSDLVVIWLTVPVRGPRLFRVGPPSLQSGVQRPCHP